MRIQFLTGLAGAAGSWHAGDIVDWDDADAARLIAAGFARRADEPEAASLAGAPENAMRKPPAKRGRSKDEAES